MIQTTAHLELWNWNIAASRGHNVYYTPKYDGVGMNQEHLDIILPLLAVRVMGK